MVSTKTALDRLDTQAGRNDVSMGQRGLATLISRSSQLFSFSFPFFIGSQIFSIRAYSPSYLFPSSNLKKDQKNIPLISDTALSEVMQVQERTPFSLSPYFSFTQFLPVLSHMCSSVLTYFSSLPIFPQPLHI